MKHILTSLALLTLTTTLSHSMLGEFREIGKKLAPVVKRSVASLTGVYSEIPSAITPKLSRAFSDTPKIDIYAWKRQTSSLLKQKLELDTKTITTTEDFDTTPANGIDRKLVDRYIKELRSQNFLNCQIINELCSLYPEEPIDTSKFNHPPVV